MECIIAMAIGLGVVVILIFIRQRLNPSASSEIPKYQPARSFDEIINQDSRLKPFILEAKQDGATYIAHDGTISFYRMREDKYERRYLEEMPPTGYLFWLSDWRKCKKLPEHALAIPDTI